MTDEGADKKNSCHELSCVPGSLLEAGDTRVNKRVKKICLYGAYLLEGLTDTE